MSEETLQQIDECLAEIKSKLNTLYEDDTPSTFPLNNGAANHEDNARKNLHFAFMLTSLFYSTLRMNSDSLADVKAHPVHKQINIIKEHYVKVDRVVSKRKSKELEKRNQVINRIVQRTEDYNRAIIDKQEREKLKR